MAGGVVRRKWEGFGKLRLVAVNDEVMCSTSHSLKVVLITSWGNTNTVLDNERREDFWGAN
jgi:hypothetical protein